MSLVEKAKSIQIPRKAKSEVSVDEVELAIAWMKGEVTTKQCEIATEKNAFESRAGRFLIEAYRRGLISAK